MKIALLALALLSATPLPGLAADDKYIDDRSDAAALVRSLYNAISRKEYGRAWDYFGDQKPAKTFDKFAEGYDDTARVDVATGGISEEGAAGSTFYPGRRRHPGDQQEWRRQRICRLLHRASCQSADPGRRRSRRCIWKRAR